MSAATSDTSRPKSDITITFKVLDLTYVCYRPLMVATNTPVPLSAQGRVKAFYDEVSEAARKYRLLTRTASLESLIPFKSTSTEKKLEQYAEWDHRLDSILAAVNESFDWEGHDVTLKIDRSTTKRKPGDADILYNPRRWMSTDESDFIAVSTVESGQGGSDAYDSDAELMDAATLESA